jgi:hypothetical protein
MRLRRRQYRFAVIGMIVIGAAVATISFAKPWTRNGQTPISAAIGDLAESLGFSFDAPVKNGSAAARTASPAGVNRTEIDRFSVASDPIDWSTLAAVVNHDNQQYGLAGSLPPLDSDGWSAQPTTSAFSSESETSGGAPRSSRNGFGGAGFGGSGASGGGGASPNRSNGQSQLGLEQSGAAAASGATASAMGGSDGRVTAPSAAGLSDTPNLSATLPVVIQTGLFPLSEFPGRGGSPAALSTGAGLTQASTPQETVAVPEPASLLFLGGGLAVALYRRSGYKH